MSEVISAPPLPPKIVPKSTLREICGICLRPDCHMRDFFKEQEYISLFQKITDINLSDGYNRVPKRICLDCHSFLDKAKIFCESARRSNEIFHRHSQRTATKSNHVPIEVKPIEAESKDYVKPLLCDTSQKVVIQKIPTYKNIPKEYNKSNNVIFETYPYVYRWRNKNRVARVKNEIAVKTDIEDLETAALEDLSEKNTEKLTDFVDYVECEQTKLTKSTLIPSKNKLKMKIDKRGSGILKYDPKQTKILIVKKDKVVKSGKVEKKGLKMKRSKLCNVGDVSKAVASGQFLGHNVNVLEAEPGYFKAPVMKTLRKTPDPNKPIIGDESIEMITTKYRKIETITDERLLEFDRRMAGIPKYDTERMELIILSDEEVQKERDKRRKANQYLNLPFRCETCIVGFNFQFKLEKHNKMKHEEANDKLKCDICETYCVPATLPVHRNKHYFRYQCTKCDVRKFNREAISLHYEKEHTNNSYTCEKCGKVSQTIKRHVYHMKTHGPRVECHICGQTYMNKSSLSGHLSVHKYGKQAAAKRYRPLIPETDPETGSRYYCQPCNLYFKNKMVYMSHIKRTVKHAAPDTLRYECDICQAKFITRTNMSHHVKWVHHKIGVLCPHCGKAFPNPFQLQLHVRFKHQNISKPKDNLCDVCGISFTTKNLLRRHHAVHLDLREYKCTECAATFKQEATRKTHYQIVHEKIKRPRSKKKQATNILTQAAEMSRMKEEIIQFEVELQK